MALRRVFFCVVVLLLKESRGNTEVTYTHTLRYLRREDVVVVTVTVCVWGGAVIYSVCLILTVML